MPTMIPTEPFTPRSLIHTIGERRIAVIPAVDVARLIGYARQAIWRLLKRNEDLFAGHVHKVTILATFLCKRKDNGTAYTCTRWRSMDCLDDVGFAFLIGRCCTARVKDPAKATEIVRTQRGILAQLRAVQGNHCPAADDRIMPDRANLPPLNAIRATAKSGVPAHKGSLLLYESRALAALPTREWYRTERAAVERYLNTRHTAILLELSQITGLRVTKTTLCRWRQTWRRTRAALAEHGLFTTLTPTPNPQPAALDGLPHERRSL